LGPVTVSGSINASKISPVEKATISK